VSGNPEIDAVLAYVKDRHRAWQVSVDEPASPSGRWFVDLSHPSGRRALVEWRPDHGFSLSSWTRGAEPGYGDGPDETHRSVRDTLPRLDDLLR
jgi:hypothetical protein